jgi:hypothetical protein
MCAREIRAREKVWLNAHKEQRYQWACIMEGLYLEAKKTDGARFTKYDWLPPEDRPAGSGLAITGKEWSTVEEAHRMMRHQDTDTQRLAIRQMLSFASGAYEAAKAAQGG